ncbi:hypothetical protein ONZ43_g5492 [Nemania bipapillata]|uniref:Uncharacterized protein n=1 Tax=Nemania bipapillata TaxID=110536 RepID=A0ACC2I9Z5_9PEZI|nr:hypothetical protein ONZ43_g5492 [Nemania bipapillata]
MGAGVDNAAIYDAALKRRQSMMGASGPMALVKNFRVFRIALFACIGGVLYGYNQGMFSGLLTMPAFQSHMGEYDPFDPTADQTKKGWLTAILELGAWIGTLMSGFVAETISRKYGILVAVSVFVIGVVIQATAQYGGHDVILAGRFITGMGVGSLAIIIPIYNSEVAPPEVRGALVALQQLAITFGILISFWIDYGTNYIGGTKLGEQQDAAWLVPICLQLFPAVVLFFGMLFIAEHFPQLREPTAWNTFKLQFVAIKSLFQTKAMFKRVIVATVTMFFQQWTGINAWASQAAAGWAAVVFVWIFIINFGFSWGPCAWIIVAEIWPLSSRPYGSSLGASSNWLNNFIVGQVTPQMLNKIGYGSYILFGLLTFLGAGFVWFFDVIFGSQGIAQADFERMAEINREIGLTAMLQGFGGSDSNHDIMPSEKLKEEEMRTVQVGEQD